jgi:hypothetical protein
MITTERMQEIVAAVTLGADPRPKDAEERRFVDRTTHDVAGIRALGHEVSIPPEWPDLGS